VKRNNQTPDQPSNGNNGNPPIPQLPNSQTEIESIQSTVAGIVNDRERGKGQIPVDPELQQNNVLIHLAVITLKKSGMSDTMISNQTGISRQAVDKILSNERLEFLHNGRTDVYRKALPMLLLEVATSAIVSITPDDLKALNALQRVTLSAIAIDKARLLMGESTENLAIREFVPKMQGEMTELLKCKDDIMALIKSRYGDKAIDNQALSVDKTIKP
jgi:hypothetical protein